jgi:hypothetical protein
LRADFEEGDAMNDISWNDLNPAEQHAIAVLAVGISAEVCDPIALLMLERARLIRGARLTAKALQLRKAAILQKLSA